MHPFGGENLLLTELYYQEHTLQIKGRDSLSLFGTCDASLRALPPVVGPPIHKMIRELKHISYEERLRELG